MDATTTQVLLSGGSPIALLLVGYWIKRMTDDRTARILKSNNEALLVAQATKIVAEAAAQSAAENAETAKVIVKKVDGTLSKAVTDLADLNLKYTSLTASFVDFQAKVDRLIQTGTGKAAVEHIVSQPVPSSAEGTKQP